MRFRIVSRSPKARIPEFSQKNFLTRFFDVGLDIASLEIVVAEGMSMQKSYATIMMHMRRMVDSIDIIAMSCLLSMIARLMHARC